MFEDSRDNSGPAGNCAQGSVIGFRVSLDRKCIGRIVITNDDSKDDRKMGEGEEQRSLRSDRKPLGHPSVPLIQFLVPHLLSTPFSTPS